jgi:UDPglucose 6-dehydrogenase
VIRIRIGVVGYGVVGKAVAHGFRSRGHEVYVNDLKPLKNEKTREKRFLINRCDLIFICVPTPPKPDGAMNLTYVEQAVDELHKSASAPDSKRGSTNDPIVVIKSTVVPGTTRKLASKFPKLTFAANPEFLRMKYASHDFLNERRIVIGAHNQKIAEKVAEAYRKWKCPIIITDLDTAETIKLAANCFLVLKVAYACEVANVCKVIGAEAKKVMDAVCLDPRIGKDHLDPSKGPIPKLAHCLPKDLSALIRHLEKKGYISKLLKVALEVGVESN